MNKPKSEDWMIRFDEKFTNLYTEPDCLYTITTIHKPNIYKTFISRLLKEQREEMVKKIEVKLDVVNKPFAYNDAINDVINLIKQLK